MFVQTERIHFRATDSDADDLAHLFCAHCWKIADQRGWLKRTFCGHMGKPAGNGAVSYDPVEECLVCEDMVQRPCKQCGHRATVG